MMMRNSSLVLVLVLERTAEPVKEHELGVREPEQFEDEGRRTKDEDDGYVVYVQDRIRP